MQKVQQALRLPQQRNAGDANRTLDRASWECAVAMLEASVMDEKGEWIEGKDWRRGFGSVSRKACRLAQCLD
jgi:hypothetical protein